MKVGIYFFFISLISYSYPAYPEIVLGSQDRSQLSQDLCRLKDHLVRPHLSQMRKLSLDLESPFPRALSPHTGSAQPRPPHPELESGERSFSRSPASGLSRLETILHTAAGIIFLEPFLSCHFSARGVFCAFWQTQISPFCLSSFLQNVLFPGVPAMGLPERLLQEAVSVHFLVRGSLFPAVEPLHMPHPHLEYSPSTPASSCFSSSLSVPFLSRLTQGPFCFKLAPKNSFLP